MIFIKTGAAEATTNSKNNQNNDNNNFAGTGASAFNNNNNNMNTIINQAAVPNVNKPESTTLSSQGDNELMYDIDIRFGGSNDKRTNQKPPNKV